VKDRIRRLWHRAIRQHPWRFVPGYEQHGTVTPTLLVCDPCEVCIKVTLPAGHPDSLTAELTKQEEALLARLDAETWPKTARTGRCRDVLERMFPLDYLPRGEAA
jgi:hypothetical protein